MQYTLKVKLYVHMRYIDKIVGYSLNMKACICEYLVNYHNFKIDEDIAFTACKFPCIKSALQIFVIPDL